MSERSKEKVYGMVAGVDLATRNFAGQWGYIPEPRWDEGHLGLTPGEMTALAISHATWDH